MSTEGPGGSAGSGSLPTTPGVLGWLWAALRVWARALLFTYINKGRLQRNGVLVEGRQRGLGTVSPADVFPKLFNGGTKARACWLSVPEGFASGGCMSTRALSIKASPGRRLWGGTSGLLPVDHHHGDRASTKPTGYKHREMLLVWHPANA